MVRLRSLGNSLIGASSASSERPSISDVSHASVGNSCHLRRAHHYGIGGHQRSGDRVRVRGAAISVASARGLQREDRSLRCGHRRRGQPVAGAAVMLHAEPDPSAFDEGERARLRLLGWTRTDCSRLLRHPALSVEDACAHHPPARGLPRDRHDVAGRWRRLDPSVVRSPGGPRAGRAGPSGRPRTPYASVVSSALSSQQHPRRSSAESGSLLTRRRSTCPVTARSFEGT